MRRRTAIQAAVLLAATPLAACGGKGDSAAGDGKPRRGGRITVAQPFEPVRGNNFFESDDPSLMTLLSGTVYSKLVELNVGPGVTRVEIVPDLATGWDISSDGKTYAFTLRDDVRWQKIAPVNGRPFVADDVVATFTGLKASQSPHKWMIEPMDSVRAEGDHRVVFTLKQPYAPFLEYLAFHFNVILPREGVEGKFDMSKDAIGTGPFMVADHKRNVEWVLQRNPDYYQQGKPYLDEIRLPIISDSTAATAALRSGRLDIAGQPFDVVDSTFKNNDKFTVVDAPSALVSFDINPTSGPFTDLRVRRAVMMAIDWQAMGENTRGKTNNTSLLRPDITDAALTDAELKQIRPHDPQRARQMLAEAGYPNGFETTMLVQKLGDPDVREGEWIVADLEKVGIKASIEIVDPATAIKRRRDHQFALCKAARAVTYPDQTIQDFRTGSAENYSAISDPTVDRMIAESRTTLDENKRNDIYREFQKYMETDIAASVLPIQLYSFWVLSKRVQGFFPSPIYQGRRYADMWVTD